MRLMFIKIAPKFWIMGSDTCTWYRIVINNTFYWYKVTTWHAYAAQRTGVGIAQTLSQPVTRRKWVITTALRTLYPKTITDIHRTAGWGPVRNARKILTASGFKWQTQPVASRYTVYAILATTQNWMIKKNWIMWNTIVHDVP